MSGSRLVHVIQPFDSELESGNHIAVVIDVLRATTSIVHALENGCKQVVPVVTVEDAFNTARSFDNDSLLLAGERKGHKVSGFDLGNSPESFSSQVVEGKIIVLTTTNGTRAMHRAAGADEVLVGCIRNLNSVVARLAGSDKDVVFYCAGTNGERTLEDDVCAGMIASLLAANGQWKWDFTDPVRNMMALADQWQGDLPSMMRHSHHGQYLLSQGFENDLDFCARANTSKIVPVFHNNRIM